MAQKKKHKNKSKQIAENNPSQETSDAPGNGPETVAPSKADLEENLKPADRAGMIAGYVTGSVMSATGITLLIVHIAKKKRERRVALSTAPGGLSVSF